METTHKDDSIGHIAFLCFSALPYAESWGGTQRVHYMANTLSSSFDVSIFAPKSSDIKINDDIERKYKTIFYEDKISRKLFRVNNSTIRESTGNQNKHYTIKSFLRTCAISALKQINSIFYNEPTYFKGIVSSLWIHKYSSEILSKIKENDISALIISIPPWNIISVAFIKKVKKLGCKVIVDYRDPWNCWNNHKGISLIKERKIAQLADAIFVTNENHAEKLQIDLKIDSSKINVIMNGYDAKKWEEVSYSPITYSKMLEIAFIGSIQFGKQNTFRDPSKFIDALAAFEHKDQIRFRVIGCKDESVIKMMEKRIPHFEMIDSVPQLESFYWMMKSDVLINFHTTTDNSSKYLIAGKTFDYYRSGAQILSINGPQSYERFFIENNNAGYYSPNDTTEILKTLQKIYGDWQSDKIHFRKKFRDDITYSRQYQNELAKSILINLLNQ